MFRGEKNTTGRAGNQVPCVIRWPGVIEPGTAVGRTRTCCRRAERMLGLAPAATFAGRWLESFREFPPRQKPGSFNLDRVMEAVMSPQGSGR